MAKLILLSIIIAAIAIPTRTAKDPDARRGLRKTLLYIALFNVVYVLAVRFLYMRFI